MSALLEGMIAGFGIAIPLGAVSILLVNLALEKGFGLGFVAGVGAATVDCSCAALAVFTGAAIAELISPYSLELQVASGLVLVAMGAFGLLHFRKVRPGKDIEEDGRMEALKVYAKFIAITLLNPFTVAYFAALIIGKGPTWSFTTADCLLFVTGVAIASVSWQTLLAAIGAVARSRLTPRFMGITVLVGNAIVVLLGVQILLTL
ncbi:MAG: LysE family transporter [Euryarchaeota archaeon]|nr:LysE family transporter [Euryarchaeota archaeon]